MTFRLVRFGSTDLPLAAAEFDAGTAGSRSAVVPTIDGFFDADGTGTAARALPYQLPLRAELVEATLAALRTTRNGLAALRGDRLALWREWSDDGAYQWCWARLLQIPAARGPRNVYWAPVELVFEVLSPWYGAGLTGDGWDLDDGEYFDDGLYLDVGTETVLNVSPKTITLTHDGDAEITDISITVTAGAAAITALTVKVGTTWEWTYTGTINIGQALVVNCGAYTIKNNGTADFANWDLTANHNQNHWFALQPGSNTITVTLTGGSTDSTIEFEYSEAWE